MSDDEKSEGADGWVDPYAQTEWGLDAVSDAPPQPPSMEPPTPLIPPPRTEMALKTPEQIVDDGKGMALLSHASVLVGLPLFAIPMLQKDNEFALHHAKAAAVNFIFFLVVLMIIFVTCGLGIVLLPLPYIPMIVGAINSANGERASGWAWGGVGERMFPGVTVDEETHLLE